MFSADFANKLWTLNLLLSKYLLSSQLKVKPASRIVYNKKQYSERKSKEEEERNRKDKEEEER